MGRRTAAIVLALAVELLLLLALLTLAPRPSPRPERPVPTSFTIAPEPPSTDPPEASPETPETAPETAEPDTPTPPAPAPVPAPPVPARPAPDAPAAPEPAVRLSSVPAPAAQPAPAPPAPAAAPAPPAAPARRRAPAGPPNTGGPPGWADTPRVGTAPNGEPLYAAAWYREPYDSELTGYLSTATGPGWGLIACRTVPDYRVEDCVALGESPERSNIARAVLAAAWQFRVRPPRLGGQSQVGAWVRIRIDYGTRAP